MTFTENDLVMEPLVNQPQIFYLMALSLIYVPNKTVIEKGGVLTPNLKSKKTFKIVLYDCSKLLQNNTYMLHYFKLLLNYKIKCSIISNILLNCNLQIYVKNSSIDEK